MSEKDGGPAFPPNAGWRDDNMNCRGLSMRDWFAGKAMNGLLASDEGYPCESETPEGIEQEKREYAENIAKAAYRFADAMLKERAK